MLWRARVRRADGRHAVHRWRNPRHRPGHPARQRPAALRRRRFSPAELVAALTTGGNRALGWPDAGRIAPGAPSELVALRLDSPRTAGCDPSQAILAASASDIHTVITNGTVLVEDGGHCTLGDTGVVLSVANNGVLR